MNKYYLAYGSNMNMEQMEWRCPGAIVVGTTTIDDYEMTFRSHNTRGGVANIEPKAGSAVRGLVWKITPAGEKALDRYEGYPWLYTKEKMKVEVDGKELTAMVYIMAPGYKKACPRQDYVMTIAQGYRDCGFDIQEFFEWVNLYTDKGAKDFDEELIKEQIIAIRDTGFTNMFDRVYVQYIADDMGFDELSEFIDAYPGQYANFILNGRFR